MPSAWLIHSVLVKGSPVGKGKPWDTLSPKSLIKHLPGSNAAPGESRAARPLSPLRARLPPRAHAETRRMSPLSRALRAAAPARSPRLASWLCAVGALRLSPPEPKALGRAGSAHPHRRHRIVSAPHHHNPYRYRHAAPEGEQEIIQQCDRRSVESSQPPPHPHHSTCHHPPPLTTRS